MNNKHSLFRRIMSRRVQLAGVLLPILVMVGVMFGVDGYEASRVAGLIRSSGTPFYTLRTQRIGDGGVTSIALGGRQESLVSIQGGTEILESPTFSKVASTRGTLAGARFISLNSRDDIIVGGNNELAYFNRLGTRERTFQIPLTTTSIAALDDGRVVLANVQGNSLITVIDPNSGERTQVGSTKLLDSSSQTQNRFLNAGKVTRGRNSDFYFVSTNSPHPVIQHYSVKGELLGEFEVSGATIDLQVEPARNYLSRRRANCTGGYSIVRTIAYDRDTDHIWIGINGMYDPKGLRDESATLYEYTADGEKLAEYALQTQGSAGKQAILTDVSDILVRGHNGYVLTSGGNLFRFDAGQRTETAPIPRTPRQLSLVSKIYNRLTALFVPRVHADEEPPCPDAQDFTCAHNCGQGFTPTSADCKAALSTEMSQGEIVIDSNCQAGSSQGEHGGCSQTITGCRTDRIRVTHSLHIYCEAIPSPTPPPDPSPTPTVGEGGGSCEQQYGPG